MAQWSEYSNGQRIKLLRGKEITQAALAEMTGLSLPTIRAAEQDKALTLATLMKVAKALGTDTSTILGQTEPRSGASVSERTTLRRLSHAVHDIATGDVPPGTEPAELAELHALVDHAWDLYGDSNYAELGATLPGLLATAYATHATANVTERESTTGALSDAFQVCAYMANQLQARDLAYAAAAQARTHAKRAGDPLRIGRVEACRSWIYRRDHRVAESLELVERAAADLRPSYATASVEHLTVYGNLVNHCAVAASRIKHQEERARDYLSQAHSVGARLGAEHRLHGGAFGPATAAVKAVDINLHVGDVGTALDLIDTMPDLSGLSVAVQHRYELDKALAQARAGQWDKSLDTLEEVCTKAPQWARHQTVPGLIVQRIGARSTARLRHVAALLGVQAVPHQ